MQWLECSFGVWRSGVRFLAASYQKTPSLFSAHFNTHSMHPILSHLPGGYTTKAACSNMLNVFFLHITITTSRLHKCEKVAMVMWMTYPAYSRQFNWVVYSPGCWESIRMRHEPMIVVMSGALECTPSVWSLVRYKYSHYYYIIFNENFYKMNVTFRKIYGDVGIPSAA